MTFRREFRGTDRPVRFAAPLCFCEFSLEQFQHALFHALRVHAVASQQHLYQETLIPIQRGHWLRRRLPALVRVEPAERLATQPLELACQRFADLPVAALQLAPVRRRNPKLFRERRFEHRLARIDRRTKALAHELRVEQQGVVEADVGNVTRHAPMIKPISQPHCADRTKASFGYDAGLIRLAAMLIVNASTVALKKNETMQCTVPRRRIARVTSDTSAVWPDVPMMAAK